MGKPSTVGGKQKFRPNKGVLFGAGNDELQRPKTRASPVPPPLESHAWPANVRRLTHCVASPLLPQHLHSLCAEIDDADPHSDASTAGCVVVRLIPRTSPHPARGQYGLFAAHDLPPRTPLCAYFGTLHTQQETNEKSEFDLGIEGPAGEQLGIDATKAGSIARFCNDYRGILPRANAEFKDFVAEAAGSSAAPQGLSETASLQKALPGAARSGAARKAASESESEESDSGKEDEEYSESGQEQDAPAQAAAAPAPPARRPRVLGQAIYSGSKPIKRGEEVCVSYGKGFWSGREGGGG